MNRETSSSACREHLAISKADRGLSIPFPSGLCGWSESEGRERMRALEAVRHATPDLHEHALRCSHLARGIRANGQVVEQAESRSRLSP